MRRAMRYSDGSAKPAAGKDTGLHDALEARPLLLDERTYNTSHPDYDAGVVRNFPGHIFNRDKPCGNAALGALLPLARGDEVPDAAWDTVLGDVLAEAAAVPHAGQIFER